MILKEQAKCEKIARTGRVQSWLDSSEGRLPVSCTVFVVEDTMEGDDGIEQSWRFVSHGLRNGAGVAIHLSKLREKGKENGKGLVASGPVSFGRIYSALNEILRRGGRYKNGAVVLHLDYDHPDLLSFINASRTELPWVKRCVNVDHLLFDKLPSSTIDALLLSIAKGDIWLNKIRRDMEGNRIYGNVCLEVYLPHRGTCLLQHVNLGACSINNIEDAFVEGMKQLCSLHSSTGVGETGEYLSPSIDKQIGLGILGLANFLSIHGISYEHFGEALEALLNEEKDQGTSPSSVMARKAAEALYRGIWKASSIAKAHGMERAFCIAPTASCSYRYLDAKGFTTAPEIAPPIGRLVDRDSGSFGVESFDYGNVEIAVEVGWENYYKVANNIVQMFQQTGLFHGYSFNSWSDLIVYDHQFLKDWLDSPQTSLYYALQVIPDTQRKDDAYAALDDDFKQMFNLEASREACNLQQECSSCAE